MTTPMSSADVQALMTRIREKTDLIVKQQRTADTEGFSCMGGALGLQKLRQARKALQAQLPALELVP